MELKKGSKGLEVEKLQAYLTHYSLGNNPLLIDGDFGNATAKALAEFQAKNKLVADGIYGEATKCLLEKHINENGKFVVSIHGGHGGYDANGNYCVPASVGKRYQHKGVELHTKDGWFFEGVENLYIANEVAKKLRANGIFTIVTHKEGFCDYGKLSIHSKATEPYIKLGYGGYTHSFHSNAASDEIKDKDGKLIRKRTQIELDVITGGYVFTTKGSTISDLFSKEHLQNWVNEFGAWVRLRSKGEIITTDSDAEDNFQVIREIEEMAAKYKNPFFGAFLEEAGFMTSKQDTMKIVNVDFRFCRIRAAINTALAIKAQYLQFKNNKQA